MSNSSRTEENVQHSTKQPVLHVDMDADAANLWMRFKLRRGGFPPRRDLRALSDGIVLNQLIQSLGLGAVNDIVFPRAGMTLNEAVARQNVDACLQHLLAQGMNISSFTAEAITKQDAQQLLGLVITMRNFHSTPTTSRTISAADKNDATFRACTSGDTENSCPSNNLSVKEGPQAKSQAVAKGHTMTKWKLAEEEGIVDEVEALEAEAEVEETRIELGQAEERGDKEAVTKCHERLREKEAMARQQRQKANTKNQNTSAVSGTVPGADECCCCTYKISFSKGACCSCLEDVWTVEVCSAGAAYGFFCCPCATTTLMCCNAMSCNHIAMNGNEEHPDPQNQCDPRNEIHCIPCVMGAAFLGRLLGVKYFYGGNQRHDEIKSLIPAVYAYYGESMCGLERGQVMHTQDNRDGYGIPKPKLQAGTNTEAQSTADEVYASHLEATAAAVDVDTSVNLEVEVGVETNVKTEVTADSTIADVEDHGSV